MADSFLGVADNVGLNFSFLAQYIVNKEMYYVVITIYRYILVNVGVVSIEKHLVCAKSQTLLGK